VAAPVAGSDEWTIPVYAIHSTQDEIVSYTAAKRHAEGLRATGARVEFHTVTDLTHYRTAMYAEHVATGVHWLQDQWK
jgi:predicted esterase